MLDGHSSLSSSSTPFALRWWFLLNTGGWRLSSSIGQFIGYFCSIAVVNLIDKPIPQGSGDFHFGQGLYKLLVGLAVSILISGFVIGSIYGLFHFLTLREYNISFWRCVSGNVIGWTVVSIIDAWRVYFLLKDGQYILAFVALLMSGFIITTTCWVVLQQRISSPLIWSAVSALGFLIINIISMTQTIILFSR